MEDKNVRLVKKESCKASEIRFLFDFGYRTDHSYIFLSVVWDIIEKGYSYWKFNNSLLRYTRYINKIKQLINRIKVQYAGEDQFKNVSKENIDSKD